MDEITKEIELGLKLPDAQSQPAENLLVDNDSLWDLEPFIDQIWRDMGGTVSRSGIRRVLMEITPAYENARVKTFVPILLRRDVLRHLEDELEQHPHINL